MLKRCKSEIQMLRHQLAETAPKAEAYDMLQTVLGMLPQKTRGGCEDILWIIHKEAEKIEREIAQLKESKARTVGSTI